ncbi:Polygalacturonase [Glycine soja]|nr:Polygalacturonase [Glycine soja]
MKNYMNMKLNSIALVIGIAFSVWSSSCTAARVSHWRKLKAAYATTFNVLDYGAKGDGHADDTKAFEDAWAAACKVEGSTMVVPSDSVFLVKPISFSGPNCEPNIVDNTMGILFAMILSDIYVHNVNCGPGHGISIGSLGKENTKACVRNVTVQDVTIQNTLTVVFICIAKGGSGSVQNIMFSHVQVSGVKTPILIDQYYCEGGKRGNESSAVAVSSIHYVNIKGTYTKVPIYFACSDNLPCTGITLDTIQLESTQTQNSNVTFCWEAYGELKTITVPPVKCLQRGNPPSTGINSKIDSC